MLIEMMGTAVHKLKPSPLAKHLGVVNHVALIHSIGRGTHKAWAQLIVYHCGSHKWSHDHLNIMVHEFLSLSHELLCPFGPSFGPPIPRLPGRCFRSSHAKRLLPMQPQRRGWGNGCHGLRGLWKGQVYPSTATWLQETWPRKTAGTSWCLIVS